MTPEISLKSDFLHWSVQRGDQVVGALKVPYLRHYLFRFGNASLSLGEDRYELTFPYRAADPLGERDSSVKLLRAGSSEVLLEIHRSGKGGILELNFLFQGGSFRVRRLPQGWEVHDGAAVSATIRSSSGWMPRYDFQGAQWNGDLPVVAAILWSIHCPLELV